MIREVTVYVTNDGMSFPEIKEAEEHVMSNVRMAVNAILGGIDMPQRVRNAVIEALVGSDVKAIHLLMSLQTQLGGGDCRDKG